MNLYVTLQCKPVVKQFIINRYGSPVIFPHNDWLRSILVLNLQRPNRHHEAKLTLQHYTETIPLPIKMREYTNYGNELTKTSTMHINQVVQDLIEEWLFLYLQHHHLNNGMLLKDAVANFRKEYIFPEASYTDDAIFKYWQRTCKRRGIISTKNNPETVLSLKNIA